MKLFASISLTLACCFGFVCAQTRMTAAERQLRKLHDERHESADKGDKRSFGRLLADSYLGTSSSGSVETKAQILSRLRPVPEGFDPAYTIEDVKVIIYGDTAVMSFREDMQVTVNKQRVATSSRHTYVYIKGRGRWLLISHHNSQIPRTQAAFLTGMGNRAPRAL